MPYDPPPELASLTLAQIADLVATRRLPPLDAWNPQQVSDSHMEIRADGTWWHKGGRITRPAMVRAFASLLLRDADGAHWLCTPYERQRIAVADAPFLAVDLIARDGALAFRLNTDDVIIAGPDHPLRVAGTAEAPAVYLAVRHGCEARLNRSTWLQLAELAEGPDWGVTSQGQRFALMPA